MSSRAVELRDEVLALSAEDRAELVIELIDSLDDRQADSVAGLTQVWSDEVARRAAQIDAGEAQLDSWDDLITKIARSRRPG